MSYSKLKHGEPVPFNETLSIQLIQQKDLVDIFKMFDDEKVNQYLSLPQQTKPYTKDFLLPLLKILKKHSKSSAGPITQRLSFETIKDNTWG